MKDDNDGPTISSRERFRSLQTAGLISRYVIFFISRMIPLNAL